MKTTTVPRTLPVDIVIAIRDGKDWRPAVAGIEQRQLHDARWLLMGAEVMASEYSTPRIVRETLNATEAVKGRIYSELLNELVPYRR